MQPVKEEGSTRIAFNRLRRRQDGSRDGSGRAGPENRTDSSRLLRARAYFPVSASGAGATKTDAPGIQDSQRAITFRSAFLGIEGMIGRTEQTAIGLQPKSRSWESSRKRLLCPLRRTIFVRWGRLAGWNRQHVKSGRKFGRAHGSRSEMLAQFQRACSTPIETGSG